MMDRLKSILASGLAMGMAIGGSVFVLVVVLLLIALILAGIGALLGISVMILMLGIQLGMAYVLGCIVHYFVKKLLDWVYGISRLDILSSNQMQNRISVGISILIVVYWLIR